MKICEFFKQQFDNAKANAKWFAEDSKYIVDEMGFEYGSFEWLNAMAKKYFGGSYYYNYVNAGITLEQLKEAKAVGYMKHVYSQCWEARQLNQQDWWGLTKKGLKAFYEAYKGKF